MAGLHSRRRVLIVAAALSQCQCALFTLLVFLVQVALATCHYGDEFDNVLLCRQCGHEVAQASAFVTVSTSQAIRRRNDTILGKENVLIQLLKNPQGRHFEIVTTSTADVAEQPQLNKEHTWFDGYAWKIISCPQCRSHLGWYFEPTETKKEETCQDKDDDDDDDDDDDVCDGRADDENENEEKEEEKEKNPFHALILRNLIHEEYADSLVVQPKVYGG